MKEHSANATTTPIASPGTGVAAPRRWSPTGRRLWIAAVILILAVSAGLRLWRLDFPAEYVFDEVYYVKDGRMIVDGRVGPTNPLYRWIPGDSTSWPHPDMGKFAIAAGIILFGDRAIGWRLPAVVAGMVVLVCVYPVARRLGLSRAWALVALLFAAADPLGITQSRVAMLDIFVAAWTVLCIYLALRYVQDGHKLLWLVLCGLAGGLALATKWSGVLALLAAGLIVAGGWLVRRSAAPELEQVPGTVSLAEAEAPSGVAPGGGHEPVATTGDRSAPSGDATAAAPPSPDRRIPRALVDALPALGALVLVPAIVYMASYAQYFISGHTFADWWELQRQMWMYSIDLDAEHSYASIAPSWIIDYRPVWYYFRGTTEHRGVVAIGNPFLWWGATLALVAAPIVALLRRGTLMLVPAAIVAVLYLPWFATARTSFLFYMTPVAPFLAVLVAAGLAQFAGLADPTRRRWLLLTGAALATALLWSPVGRLGQWLFWTLPRELSPALGWVGVAVACLLGVGAVMVLASPRLRRHRPLVATAAAGLIVGIVVAFLPVVLAIPMTPEEFSRIYWFPSWI